MMSKVDEILELLKTNVTKKEDKKSCPIVWILAVVGVVVAIAGICYGLYRYFSVQLDEELEDDFDDDFDDDFFEDEDADQIIIPKQDVDEAVEADLKVEEN